QTKVSDPVDVIEEPNPAQPSTSKSISNNPVNTGSSNASPGSNLTEGVDTYPEVGAIIHDKDNKKEWSPLTTRPSTKVLIIADSNMKLAKTRGNDYEVHAFPEAYLSHVCKILDDSVFSESLTDIIVAVGINHRDMDFKVKTLPDLTKIVGHARKYADRVLVHFLG